MQRRIYLRRPILPLLWLISPVLYAQIEPESLAQLGVRGPVHCVVVRSQEAVDSLVFDRRGRLVEELRAETDGDTPPYRARYEYDAEGRLQRVIALGRNARPASMVECRYDAGGRRVCEQRYRMAPERQLEEETLFSYAGEGWVEATTLLAYEPDGRRRDSVRTRSASLVTEESVGAGWIRSVQTIPGIDPARGAEITYRDRRGVLRRRVVGSERNPESIDDFDSLGRLTAMFRTGSAAKPVAYFFTNDSAGNPLRRTMGFVESIDDYAGRKVASPVVTDFIYQYDRMGNWIRCEERTAADGGAQAGGQTLNVQTRQIAYRKQ